MEKNKRKSRQDDIRSAAKYTKACTDILSFEAGAKWADYHPDWRENEIPEPQENKDGLPKLYLCQILILDMTFGYRYSYRIGFITKDGKWNIEQFGSSIKVIRWQEIYGNESESQFIEDIQRYEREKKNSDVEENKNQNKIIA